MELPLLVTTDDGTVGKVVVPNLAMNQMMDSMMRTGTGNSSPTMMPTGSGTMEPVLMTKVLTTTLPITRLVNGKLNRGFLGMATPRTMMWRFGMKPLRLTLMLGSDSMT